MLRFHQEKANLIQMAVLTAPCPGCDLPWEARYLKASLVSQTTDDYHNDLMVIRDAALEEARQSGALQRSADAYTNLSAVSKEAFEHLLPPVMLGMPATLGAAERGPVSKPDHAVAIPATAVHLNNVSSPAKQAAALPQPRKRASSNDSFEHSGSEASVGSGSDDGPAGTIPDQLEPVNKRRRRMGRAIAPLQSRARLPPRSDAPATAVSLPPSEIIAAGPASVAAPKSWEEALSRLGDVKTFVGAIEKDRVEVSLVAPATALELRRAQDSFQEQHNDECLALYRRHLEEFDDDATADEIQFGLLVDLLDATCPSTFPAMKEHTCGGVDRKSTVALKKALDGMEARSATSIIHILGMLGTIGHIAGTSSSPQKNKKRTLGTGPASNNGKGKHQAGLPEVKAVSVTQARSVLIEWLSLVAANTVLAVKKVR